MTSWRSTLKCPECGSYLMADGRYRWCVTAKCGLNGKKQRIGYETPKTLEKKRERMRKKRAALTQTGSRSATLR